MAEDADVQHARAHEEARPRARCSSCTLPVKEQAHSSEAHGLSQDHELSGTSPGARHAVHASKCVEQA